jgi:hypothetical protein
MTSSFLRFLDHTQRRTTVGRTPLDEWSARRRDLYLTTHNTHNRQISVPPLGFEPTISGIVQKLQTVGGVCLWDRLYARSLKNIRMAVLCDYRMLKEEKFTCVGYINFKWFWNESVNPFQSNFSANRIHPSSYLFWAVKRLVDYL